MYCSSPRNLSQRRNTELVAAPTKFLYSVVSWLRELEVVERHSISGFPYYSADSTGEGELIRWYLSEHEMIPSFLSSLTFYP